MDFKEFNNDTFAEIKLKSLIEETEKIEHYWVNVAEILGVHKQKLEKSGDEVYDRIPREHYTLYFLKSHASELSKILQILRQNNILQILIELDPSNRDIYESGLKKISR